MEILIKHTYVLVMWYTLNLLIQTIVDMLYFFFILIDVKMDFINVCEKCLFKLIVALLAEIYILKYFYGSDSKDEFISILEIFQMLIAPLTSIIVNEYIKMKLLKVWQLYISFKYDIG